MGEIRLTDDDKDRKYRIRINEDGEEELEVIQPEEEPQEEELIGFQVDDDEETTPEEQSELMEAARAEQERLAREEAKKNIEKAKAKIQEGDNEFALVALDAAQQAWDEEWEIYTLKAELLTNYFTDFSKLEEVVSLQDGYKKFVPEEQKQIQRGKYAGTVSKMAAEQRSLADSTNEENEAKKAERRVRFKAQRNKALRNFLFAFVPFVILLCVAIGFSTVMFSQGGGVLFVLPIVFFALAAIALIISIILLHPLVKYINRLRLNERNKSTAIGRTYIECSERAELFDELYNMLMYSEPVKEEAAAVTEDTAEEN